MSTVTAGGGGGGGGAAVRTRTTQPANKGRVAATSSDFIRIGFFIFVSIKTYFLTFSYKVVIFFNRITTMFLSAYTPLKL
jgi:hypothetical protein